MGFLGDIRGAFRQVRRAPGFSFIIILTLGLAMGISTALFSLADDPWSRNWPVREPERMVASMIHLSLEETHHWAANVTSFDSVAAHRTGMARKRILGRRLLYTFATPGYFDTLGVRMAMGRRFADTDDRLSTAEPEAVVSHQTWVDLFDRDPGIIGMRVSFGGPMVTITGVAQPGFNGVGSRARTQFWFAFSARDVLEPASSRMPGAANAGRDAAMIGRLRAGVSPKRAEAELASLHDRYRAERGLKPERVALESAENHGERTGGPQREAAFYTLLLAVAFLTMIACANVSNLLLARGHARRGEIAVRLSLGATRSQLLRQLLLESFILALGAGLLGLAIATVLPSHFFSSIPDFAQIIQLDFRLDFRVFGWSLLLSSLACIIFGLKPALDLTGLDTSQVLKDASGSAAPSLRTSLTSMQAFVSVLALCVAGLVLRSDTYAAARQFADRISPLVIVQPILPTTYDAERLALTKDALFKRLSQDSSVAATRSELRPVAPGERADLEVTPNYFGVLGLPFAEGRTFNATDATRSVVISETMAATLWPGSPPLGKIIPSEYAPVGGLEVIGIVRDRMAGEAASYRPLLTKDMNVFVVRDTEARFRSRSLAITTSVDPVLQLDVQSGAYWMTQNSPGSVLTIRLFSEFGGLALALTAMGIFSLSEYLVGRRRREIGIRNALGARPRHILTAVLQPAARPLVSGVGAGILGAICSGFLMRHWGLPDGVHPVDPMTYGLVSLAIGAAAIVAMWRPAISALRVEPGEALRYE